ncbi:MAG: Nramp family divalent metal transporter [Flavobacteriaceae bacterium]|nr:Nramp family divalent metal transporter [Flavobacteriaceae bacterium]
MKNWFNNIGPATLIAAAFIGPGTVTLCSIAGVGFGYDLLWAMLLSIIATIVLQEMSARLGIVSQKGLSEVLREEIKNPILKTVSVILIISAIVIGNAAYEAGNISGGVLGLATLVPNSKIEIGSYTVNYLNLIIGLLAFVLLYIGNYKILERSLIFLVLLMSVSFVLTTIITKPDLIAIFKGIFIPKVPTDSLFVIIGLIGTTVVPYNLFLHASLVKEKWHSKKDLPLARKDTFIAVIVGGIVSMTIIISASGSNLTSINNTMDLAEGLVPLYGNAAKYFLGVGLFAAGITSAITAPLAAAFVVKGIFGWSKGLQSKKFKAVWMFILILGIVFSSLQIKPIEIIKFAQITNGLLLPIISGFLLWIMNKKSVLGKYTNNITQNIFGFIILGLTVFLGLKTIFKVIGYFY